MKNRWLLNIGLALLVGALILLVLYRPGTGKEAQGTPLTAIPVDAVQRIKLVRPKQPEIVLERIGEHWRVAAARKARAAGAPPSRVRCCPPSAPRGIIFSTPARSMTTPSRWPSNSRPSA